MITQILQDALFAALAAIGFAAISRPPRRSFLYCAAIAAAGHSLRFILMTDTYFGIHIILASLISSFCIGLLAVAAAPLAKTPAETYLFPALLPMIPGIYAYRTFAALALCAGASTQESYLHYLYLFGSNGMVTLLVLLAMVVGATIPIFIFKRIAFQATRI